MVAKIQQSHGSTAGTLDYNQNKVAKEKARVLALFNMNGEETRRGIERVFERYERLNIRTENVSFQMSINPDPDRPGEKLSDDEAVAFAKDLMEGLGYAGQPIIIFEHHDIERVHYHVVSIRTNEKGKKIKDSYEHQNLQKLLEKYQQKYHYIIGNKTADEKESASKRQPLSPAVRFRPGGKDVNQQFSDIFNEALTYNFKTIVQFRTIMRSMGVLLEVNESNSPYFILQGADSNGKKVTVPIPENELEQPYFLRYEQRRKENDQKKELTDDQKKAEYAIRRRVGGTVAMAFKYAKTEQHFERILAKRGVYMTLSRNADDSLFGATFVDQQSKTAYKASELKRDVDMDAIKAAAVPESGAWAVNERLLMEEWQRRKRAERDEARLQRNLDLAALQVPRELEIRPVAPSATKEEHLIAKYAVSFMAALLGLRIRPTRSRGASRPTGVSQPRKKSNKN